MRRGLIIVVIVAVLGSALAEAMHVSHDHHDQDTQHTAETLCDLCAMPALSDVLHTGDNQMMPVVTGEKIKVLHLAVFMEPLIPPRDRPPR
jgi:hypothetical protein